MDHMLNLSRCLEGKRLLHPADPDPTTQHREIGLLPTCPILAMSRRLAIRADIERFVPDTKLGSHCCRKLRVRVWGAVSSTSARTSAPPTPPHPAAVSRHATPPPFPTPPVQPCASTALTTRAPSPFTPWTAARLPLAGGLASARNRPLRHEARHL
eukprot:scaffold14678_cov101-Isochrysis_galbana.AAC.1